jgi:hypothetical protein
MRWESHVARMGDMRNACNILVGKPEWKGLLRRHKRIWENNFSLYVREIWWQGVDRIQLAQDREQWQVFMNTAMNIRVP